MPKKRATPERIIGLLRQAEVEIAQGRTMGEVCRGLGVSEAAARRVLDREVFYSLQETDYA
jgi:hypothetical protein